ncbi:MAG: DMT family transporter [Cryomorphaceae bacterium]|nr:DMT family transporter [Cryomorphaceae bacterium]
MLFRGNYKAHLALFFVNALYGANHILAKGVMPRYLSPNVFILFRVAGATLLFWILKMFFTRNETVAKKDLRLIGLCALFGVTINQLFFFHGLNLSSSINSGIYMAINPIVVVVMSFFILKDEITPLRMTGILVGTVATILLTFTASSGGSDSALGDLFLFVNAVSYALYLVMIKPMMSKYSPLTVITWVFTFGLMYVLIFPPTFIDLANTNFELIPVEAWWKISYVIVGVTFLTYLMTMYGLKYLSPSTSAVYIYFQPVMVILFAYVFVYLGFSDDYTQTITLPKLAYMLLIFLGVYLTIRTEKKSS